MRKIVLICIFYSICFMAFSQKDPSRGVVIPKISPGLKFTENVGQWDNTILFRAQLDGGLLFLEKNCVTFNFYDKKKYRAIHLGGFEKKIFKDYNIGCHAYKVHFEGCNTNAEVAKAHKGSFYENFYSGKDPKKWKSNVQNYHQVWLKNLYSDIDYEIISSATGLKYNFHVQPGGDPSKIQMKYEGADHLKLKDGILIVKLSINTVYERKPFAYQLINGVMKEVKCNYKLNNTTLSFDFPDGYDQSHELIIDPVLVFAAQAGSTADNFGMTATFDQQGNLFSGGTVFDIGYPYVIGSYSNTFNGPPAYGNTDVFITKYNSTGTGLLYSTYMGGDRTEVVTSLITDKTGNLYLLGATSSTNFPVTAAAAYTTFAGGSNIGFISNGSVFLNGTDIYIAKFNPGGTSLLACTYYGGNGNDGVNYNNALTAINYNLAPAPGTQSTNVTNYDSLQTNYGDTYRGEIQLDTLNNVYIASSTRSGNIPIINGFDNTLDGKQDAIIAKFDTNLNNIIYSSYLGGSEKDCGNALFVRPNFEVYVTGGTCSNDFPSASGGQLSTYSGGKADGFLTRISSTGAIMQSTYIGTSLYDNSFCVSCNVAGDPYVFGQSSGNMAVIVPSGATTIYSVANTHQFITRYNNSLTTKLMSTVFGANTATMDISPSAFAVDECNGNIYLSGWGGNILTGPAMSGMPLQAATQATTSGYDFYLMALSPNAGSLLYGSYFGGGQSQEHVDGGTSRFDRKGVIYQSVCAGCASCFGCPGNDDFPIFPNPGVWPCLTPTSCPNGPNFNPSNCNNGVFKIDFKYQNTVATLNTSTVAGCPPLTINLSNATPGTGFVWYLPSGTNSVTTNPVITFNNPGTYTISLVVHDTTKCVKKDSAVKIITVHPKPTSAFTATVSQCSNTLTATNTSTGSGNSYVWHFGDATPTSTVSNPTHVYASSGTYTLSLIGTNSLGCKDTVKQPVTVFIFSPGIAAGSTICAGFTTTVSANGGTSYTWSPPATLNNPNSAQPIASPSITTIYTVQIDNNSAGYLCSKTLTTNVIIYPKPMAAFSTSINPCGGGAYFSDNSVGNVSTWQWTLTTAATSTLQNPYYFYTNGGTHTVTLIITSSDGCKDTTDQIINVPVPPPVSVSGNTIICAEKSVVLSASGGVSYQWTPTVSLSMPNNANTTASPTVSTQYSVVITTSTGCVFLLTTNVTVSQSSSIPVSAVANPPYVITGNSSTLTYIGSPGAIVTWLPPGSTTPATGYTVTAAPDKPTTYTAVASYGACNNRAMVMVEAYTEGCIEKDAFVPNTFTPNGDGQNDYFMVRGLKIEDIYFAVYNRWGEMVFETTGTGCTKVVRPT
ncbi:MAG: domain containing protein [Bacteroidetes bacterium]|nr:domain containing protein [Bacteroidota bacterium]